MIYSQLAEILHAFVRRFSGRTFYVNALAKIIDRHLRVWFRNTLG